MAIDLAAAGFAVVATALFCPLYFWVTDRLELRTLGPWIAVAVDGAMHIGFLIALVLFLENGDEPWVDAVAAALWQALPPGAQAQLEAWFGPQDFSPAP